MPTKSKKYARYDPITHILHRPDMYVGSVRPRFIDDYVSSVDNNFRIMKKRIKYAPAILRIFIEPLSNAIDNVARSKNTNTPCTTIKVNIDCKSGETMIWNDGDIIPIEVNEEEDCYNHTLIFGNLLTSSNYDDEEERYNISGRNGLGVKLTNIFSKYFCVRGLDPDSGQTFEQIWKQNMTITTEETITGSKKGSKKGYTEVSWIPDFKQFNISGYTQDIISLYCKYVVDAAMLTGINVYFNDKLIQVKNLEEYSTLYSDFQETDVLYINTDNARVVLTPSPYFQTISFVNGVYTSLGGTHVDAWTEALFRPIVKKLSSSKSSYNIGDVKRFFRLFVVMEIVNPEFESQSKHKLESSVKATVKRKDISKILRWSVIDDIKRSKEMTVLKKTERKKKNFVKIESLDPANNEGGKLGSECTLILVEGLSAKTYAVQGIEVGAIGRQGRDWFGIYALRGKLLNVRNAKASSIAKNRVISDIVKALGAKYDVDYTNEKSYKTLRYGKIMIITDADVDGIHISGLIQNTIHTLFPTLLERTEPFIVSMQTPIVKVFLNRKELVFYDEREYKKYATKYNKKYPTKTINRKYYKGLGSSSIKDITGSFGKKIIKLEKDNETNTNMHKIFHNKQSDARKEWLRQYDPDDITLTWKGNDFESISLGISDFLNTEMIKFSLDDCKRSIPGMMDGLKESQRKVLFACFKRNLKNSGKTLKVAQLAGYVAEHTGYHHGEQNLYDTIVKMAHSFVGSNNIPLLFRDGQFGSRLSGGKDAASARYIHTKLDALTRLIFRSEDDILLDHAIDDGDMVEPIFYVPILPIILINGCTAGIGTGWSCSVPCYNPLDLIDAVKCWLEQDGQVITINDDSIISLLPEINPWYRDYSGDIEKMTDVKYVSWGNVNQEKRNKVVDELPVGMWTDNFKNLLDNLLEEKQLKSVKNYSTPKKVKFVLSECKNGIICNRKTLKLKKYISTSNMVLFNEKGLIKKYKNIDEIIDNFCKIRFKYYIKRKKYILQELEKNIRFLGNKRRFLDEVLKSTIKLFRQNKSIRKSRTTDSLVQELTEKKYDKSYPNNKEKNKETESKQHGYEYLLRLQFNHVTEDKINKLDNDIASKIRTKTKLKSTSEKQLWTNDLNELEVAYKKWFRQISKEK